MSINLKEWDRQWMGRRVTMPRRLVRTETTPSRFDMAFAWQPADAPVRGVVVGVRWLQNGRRWWVGSEEGWSWDTHGVVAAAMIAEAPNRKPVPVPLEDLDAEVQPWPPVEAVELEPCA